MSRTRLLSMWKLFILPADIHWYNLERLIDKYSAADFTFNNLGNGVFISILIPNIISKKNWEQPKSCPRPSLPIYPSFLSCSDSMIESCSLVTMGSKKAVFSRAAVAAFSERSLLIVNSRLFTGSISCASARL